MFETERKLSLERDVGVYASEPVLLQRVIIYETFGRPKPNVD
jgi:hypothetical protein